MSIVVYPEAFRFAMWLHAQAESHQLEGELETANSLLSLRELVLDHPGDFEAFLLVRVSQRRDAEDPQTTGEKGSS